MVNVRNPRAGRPSYLTEEYNNTNSQNSSAFDETVLAITIDPSLPTSIRWFINQGLWAFNTRSPYDLLQQFSQ
jgi:hypothetical protein